MPVLRPVARTKHDGAMPEPMVGLAQGTRHRQVLLIDNDRNVASLLTDFLGVNGYRLNWAPRPSAADKLLAERPDLILLDVLLPERDGLEVCRELRGTGNQTPIILLASGGGDQNCIRGLRLGADDYLPKPFNPQVLLARIEAVLRRAAPSERDPGHGLRLDLERKTLDLPSGEVPLTVSEYQLLAALMAAPGRCLTREDLRAALGDGDPSGTSNRAIDIHVSRLRTKVEQDPRHPRYLITVRGEGYRFEP